MTVTKTLPVAAALAASLTASACGRTDLGRSPTQVVVDRLEASSGAEPTEFGSVLLSDVITYVKKTVAGEQQKVPTVFDDPAQITLRAVLRDAGSTGSATTPTAMNAVTFTRYHVKYVRADGRNTQGVDVPYEFDSAVTVTVQAGGTAQVGFEIVRHVAKQEAPLVGLIQPAQPPIGQPQPILAQPIVSTIAEVTLYGKDLAGNDVVASGSIGINFGDFGDPE